VQVRWDVPSTVFWYVSGEYYLGTLVIRHQLTPELTDRVLLTRAADNEPSRRVILANGGIPDRQAAGEDRFWINLGRDHHP
jgi:predicted acetyltransferase